MLQIDGLCYRLIGVRMFKPSAEQEKACCPFNNAHIFAKEKLIFHINRCKDRPKVAHLFSACRYNGLHYLKNEEIELHEQICPDKHQVRQMVATMQRNYQAAGRDRSRSREKRKKEEKQQEDQDPEEEHTLSECEDCLAVLKTIAVQDHPKLRKYLLKYEEIKKQQLQ